MLKDQFVSGLGIIRTPTSSPVREEQRSVALEVEKFIDDWPSPKGE